MFSGGKEKKIPRKIEDLYILQWANHKKLTKIFSKGIDFAKKLSWDEHPLEMVLLIHYAAAKANKAALQWILNHQGKPPGYINVPTTSELVPLHFAVLFGNFEALQQLIDQGAETNIRDETHGYTALHFAVHHAKPAAVRILLSSFVDVTIKDKTGKTAKQLAITENKHSIANLLAQQESEQEFKLVARSMVDFKNQTLDQFKSVNDQIADLQEQLTKFSTSGYNTSTLRDFKTSQATLDSGRGTYFEDESGTHTQYAYQEADKIQQNYDILMRHMRQSDHIVAKLFTWHQVTFHFKSQVKSENITIEKNEMILDFVLLGDKPIFDAFIKALNETNQCNLVRLLQPPKRQTSWPNLHETSSAENKDFSRKRASSFPELPSAVFSLLPSNMQINIDCDETPNEVFNGTACTFDEGTKLEGKTGIKIAPNEHEPMAIHRQHKHTSEIAQRNRDDINRTNHKDHYHTHSTLPLNAVHPMMNEVSQNQYENQKYQSKHVSSNISAEQDFGATQITLRNECLAKKSQISSDNCFKEMNTCHSPEDQNAKSEKVSNHPSLTSTQQVTHNNDASVQETTSYQKPDDQNLTRVIAKSSKPSSKKESQIGDVSLQVNTTFYNTQDTGTSPTGIFTNSSITSTKEVSHDTSLQRNASFYDSENQKGKRKRIFTNTSNTSTKEVSHCDDLSQQGNASFHNREDEKAMLAGKAHNDDTFQHVSPLISNLEDEKVFPRKEHNPIGSNKQRDHGNEYSSTVGAKINDRSTTKTFQNHQKYICQIKLHETDSQPNPVSQEVKSEKRQRKHSNDKVTYSEFDGSPMSTLTPQISLNRYNTSPMPSVYPRNYGMFSSTQLPITYEYNNSKLSKRSAREGEKPLKKRVQGRGRVKDMVSFFSKKQF